MLYPKRLETELKDELFKQPTSEYRGAPFWAWNCELNAEVLKEQIGFFQEMGLGGFHIHSRCGLATKYLSDEFMELVKICTDEAKRRGMLCWLYDEDRAPSGAAGGLVTSDIRYRMRMLVFSQREMECVCREEAIASGKTCLAACYDVILNEEGELATYRKIAPDAEAEGVKWFAYVKSQEPNTWYNNQTYLDTLNSEAVNSFLRITHERYRKAVGQDFGSAIPAFFTDEPEFCKCEPFRFADGDDDAAMAWTMDFPETFVKCKGYDLLDKLPEIFWELPNGASPKVRYDFYDFCTERLVQAFTDNLGRWCSENGIMLTGHMMAEHNLEKQSNWCGEVMRAYRSFQLPGIDLLWDNIEFSTAKQCQSAVHQYGREGMVSELYGVTNWDFDFREHKFQGDWQAALGVTVRVQHLSWVSMAGEAKRDFPASLNYQSPWYREYSYVENHFARLNTALTRGKPIVKVAVIHPVESFWLHCGSVEKTEQIREYLDERFEHLNRWLLCGLIDFNFISESLLPSLYRESENGLAVGEMCYETVLVPALETIRHSTIDVLKRFHNRGGRVIFMGEKPVYVDAKPSEEIYEFYNNCEHIPFEQPSLLDSLLAERIIDIRNSNGARTKNFIYTLREDGDTKWLFIVNTKKPTVKELPLKEEGHIFVKGEYTPLVYDTITGDIRQISYKTKEGRTEIPYELYAHDSLLLHLKKAAQTSLTLPRKVYRWENLDILPSAQYIREEKNVLLLDRAEYALDGGEFYPEEDILRLDDRCRELLDFASRSVVSYVQPWALPEDKAEHIVTLKLSVFSETELTGIELAMEDAEKAKIILNGELISAKTNGYYVDRSIKTVPLSKIKKGKNHLQLVLPFGIRNNIENCYLLGDFDVRIKGRKTILCKPTKELYYGDITIQGMPFYGGNLTYCSTFETKKEGILQIRVNHYRGAVIRVKLDGEDLGVMAYAPYILQKENIKSGAHQLELTLYGNRYNTFGALHDLSGNTWANPYSWRSRDYEWSYEYNNMRKMGILATPVLEFSESADLFTEDMSK